ncbi:unnamed protein product [Adineta steineri]|uniref:Uncharacterized protein n=1 Tax=Adineta steineri TaxID=433720 RepID=A0A814NJS4_9BILA|nr:unnamed protein product [Adineta steineri]
MSNSLRHLAPEFSIDEAKEIAMKFYNLNEFVCQLPSEPIDLSGKFVRTIFKGAHLIEATDNGNGFRYTYIQYADPGGRIPKILANRPQCDIILNEIEGIRKAMKNPIHSNK